MGWNEVNGVIITSFSLSYFTSGLDTESFCTPPKTVEDLRLGVTQE